MQEQFEIYINLCRFEKRTLQQAESGLKYCPPAPCLAPPVPHEGQQGLLLHLHLNLLDLVLDLYLVLVCGPPHPYQTSTFSPPSSNFAMLPLEKISTTNYHPNQMTQWL